MTPYILFLYCLSLAVGVLLVGSALLLLFCVYCYLLGGRPAREKTTT